METRRGRHGHLAEYSGPIPAVLLETEELSRCYGRVRSCVISLEASRMLYSKMVKTVVDRACKQLTWNALPSAVCSFFVLSIDLSLGNRNDVTLWTPSPNIGR